jgi:tRNA pseudouridine38-40 synthase
MRSRREIFPGPARLQIPGRHAQYEMSSTVRTLTRCDIKRNGPLLTFIIEGDGFLYKMCRGIVGTLVQVGQGKIAPERSNKYLTKRTAAPPA